MSLLLALLLAGQAEFPWLQVHPGRPCTVASAERVTFAQLRTGQDRLRGRCIAVRGIWAGRALYDGETASRAPRAESDAATASDRIGLYGSVAIERGTREPGAYIAVGLLYDCAVFAGQEVGGYCHFNLNGPILAVTRLYRRHWPSPRGYW